MAIVLALFFVAAAGLGLVAYGGTPHGGPTTICGPIAMFNHHLTVDADCRYISVGELAFSGLFFFLATVTILVGRPKGKRRR
jgi:hypothetical protein